MQNSNESTTVEYGGFCVRLSAYLIDTIIIGVPLLVIRLILWFVTLGLDGTFLTENILFQYNIIDIILYLLRSIYFIACTYLTGTTVGKRLLNLKVVRADGEEKLELLTVIYRETIGRFLNGVVGNIGYILIGLDKEKRGFHDYLSDTRVIYAKKIKTYEVKHNMTLPTMVPEAEEEKMLEVNVGFSYVGGSWTDTENKENSEDIREDFIDENK